MTIDSEDLDTSLSEKCFEDLKDTFSSVLVLTWDLFVMGNSNEMDKKAIEIIDRLHANYQLVPVFSTM